MKHTIVASACLACTVLIAPNRADASVAYHDGLTFVNFDKLFTMQSCTVEALGTTSLSSCSQLSVTPRSQNVHGTTGYGFDLTGLIAARGAGSVDEISLQYTVQICGTTVNGVTANCAGMPGFVPGDYSKNHITDAHLAVTGSVSGTIGANTVDELFVEADGMTADGLGLHTSLPFNATDDTVLPDPVQFLNVSKDIAAFCGSADCISQMSVVRQVFTQDTKGGGVGFIPEPSTLALIGGALAGSWALIRRRRTGLRR